MAKLTPNSPKVQELSSRIEEEINNRPTRRIRLLRDFFEVWQAGLRGEIPPIFLGLNQDLEDKKDPEFVEYLRLKAKFDR